METVNKEELADYKACCELLFEALGEVVSIHRFSPKPDEAGRFFRVNKAGCKLVGYTHDELLEMTPFDLLARRAPERLAAAHSQLCSEGHLQIEDAVVTKDGRSIPVEIHCRVCQIAGQQLVLSIIQNITERRKTELALRKSEEHLRTVADFTFNWESWFGPDGGLLWVSPSVERVAGYTPEQCFRIPDFMASLVCKEDLPTFRRGFADAVAGRSGEGVQFRFRRKDGEIRWASASYRPVLDGEGDCIGHRSCILDVTKNQMAESALRQSEERFRAILEQATEGFALIDEAGKVSAWNLALEKLTGLKRESVYDRPIWEIEFALLMADPRKPELGFQLLKRRWQKTLKNGQSPVLRVPEEARLQRRDGEVRYFERVVFPIDVEKRRLFGIFAHDTTERKRAEEALQASEAKLRALSRRIESVREEVQTRLAREIHDGIGQALSGMAMSLGWIGRKISATVDQEVQSELKSVEHVLAGLTSTVQDMTMRLRPRILDELGLHEALVTESQRFAARTNIQTTVDVSLERDALGNDAVTGVFRICQEALTNVYRHSGATSVHIGLQRRSRCVTLTVQDNGHGITDQQVLAPKSLGILGMQERALALGGQISVSGLPGVGTTVTLSLPMAAKVARRRRRS